MLDACLAASSQGEDKGEAKCREHRDEMKDRE